MPDWTYHPFFKPVLFRLPAETGRRLTLWLLSVQGRTAAGRALFRLFGHVHPPESAAVEAFGLRFPSPVGLGAGIDTHGSAAGVMQYLGFGFLELGPATAEGRTHRHATEPRRIAELHAIVASEHAAAPSAAALSETIRHAPVGIPIGIAVAGDDLPAAIVGAEAAAFITLPSSCARGDLAALRDQTEQPLLLRLSPDWDDAALDDVIARAEAARIDGFVIADGWPSALVEEGRLFAPALRTRALAMVKRVRGQTALPIVASGAIASPDDALAFLDAGATLLSLYDGLVYAGPGLPGRIVRALDRPPAKKAIEDATPAEVPAWSWLGICFTGLVLVLVGIYALYLSATDHMLPPDRAFLGMSSDELCRFHGCRIVRFMVHDRVSFGGSILSVGITYLWLGGVPLREGRAWAWWGLAISGAIGFGSFLTYLGHGYLDRWHAISTLLLLPFFVGGMARAYGRMRAPRGPRALLAIGEKAWLWSPVGMARLALGFAAFGMIAGGLTIMGVGMTQVFVPQDLDYMQLTIAELDAINPRLVALIAHDRAGFGGGLCSGGLAIATCLAYGLRPRSPGLWLTLLASGTIGFATAIGVHFVVGYTSFVHLLPAYAGALAFAIAMKLLYAPLCRTDPGERFADF